MCSYGQVHVYGPHYLQNWRQQCPELKEQDAVTDRCGNHRDAGASYAFQPTQKSLFQRFDDIHQTFEILEHLTLEFQKFRWLLFGGNNLGGIKVGNWPKCQVKKEQKHKQTHFTCWLSGRIWQPAEEMLVRSFSAVLNAVEKTRQGFVHGAQGKQLSVNDTHTHTHTHAHTHSV